MSTLMLSSRILLFLLNLVICILHSIGIYLLRTQQSRDGKSQLLLLNLAAVETIFSIQGMVLITLKWCNAYTPLFFISIGGSAFVLYFMLSLILLDRFMEVYRHILHKTSQFYQHKKAVCVTGWTLGLSLTASLYIARGLEPRLDTSRIIYYYVFIIGNVVVLLIALPVYGYLYYKYKQGKALIRTFQPADAPNKKTPRFSIPVLIIASFILFFAVPDLIVVNVNFNSTVQLLMNVLNKLNFIMDAVVYIFFQPSIRRRLLARWRTPASGGSAAVRSRLHPDTSCEIISLSSPASCRKL